MKVSIILPVYNVEPYVVACLQSIFLQSYANLELLIVDDCGSDKSMQLVEELVHSYSGKIDIQIIRHSVNKGLSAARNTGLNHATGEYVYFLDSDDILPDRAIENLMAEVAAHQAVDFVIGGIKTFGYRIYEYPLLTEEYIEGNENILLAYFLGKWNVMACNKLIRKSFLDHNKLIFLEGVYHEDIDFSFNLALKAQTMATCREITYEYMTRDDSISTHKKLKNYQDECLIFLKNVDKIKCIEYNDREYQKIRNTYIVNACCSFTFAMLKEHNPDISWKDRKELVIKFTDARKDFHLYVPFSMKIFLKSIFLVLPFKIQKIVVNCFI